MNNIDKKKGNKMTRTRDKRRRNKMGNNNDEGEEEEKAQFKVASDDDQEEEPSDSEDFDDYGVQSKPETSWKDEFRINKKKKVVEPDSDEENEGGFVMEEMEEADQFAAVKPWLGAIVAPDNFIPPNNKPPNAKLELAYVHGYRVKDCRNNLRYLKGGSIVYNAAAVGVVLSKKDNT